MNKKGHHEGGLTLYAALIPVVGAVAVYTGVKIKNVYHSFKERQQNLKPSDLEKRLRE